MRDTLLLSAEWSQSNSFCSIFSQAARVRMPVAQWVPAWRQAITTASMTNMVVYQGGGGIEVVGALQAVADLMLQSVTVPGPSGATHMALFPLNATFSDLGFHRLRGKGAFVVSARWSAATGRLAGPVTVESEVGGLCSLQLPPGDDGALLHVATAAGSPVLVQQTGLLWTFAAVAGETYTATATHAE